MAASSFPGYSPVPLGQAGTGEAFVLGPGTQPLNLLIRQDAAAARARQQAALLKQKEQGQDFTAFMNNANLKADGFLPFKPQIEAMNAQTRRDIDRVAHDPTLDRYQKVNSYKELVDKNNSAVDTTNEIKGNLDKVRQTAQADPRYSRQAIAAALDKTWQDENGNVIEINKFDPSKVTNVLTDARNYDATAVVKKWLADTLATDQTTVTTAARQGGYGRQNTAASNYFVVENGKIKLDPQTNNPIPRTDLPEVQLAAENDPFLKGLIDLAQSSYQEKIGAVEKKMAAYEPLSAEERQLLGEASKSPKTRADFLNELLLPHAYKRTSDVQTYNDPRAPRSSGSTGTQTVVGNSPISNANIGIETAAGNSSFSAAATLNQPYEENKGVKKEITMKQPRFSSVTVAVPGERTRHYNNLQEGQDVILGRPHLFLTSKTGVAYFPNDPSIAKDPEKSRQWIIQQLQAPDAKQKGFHVTWHIEANPAKGQNNIGDGSEEAADMASSWKQTGGPSNIKMPSYGGGSSRSMPSGTELGDKGRKIHSGKNATFYILYEGADKQLIDGRTPGYRAQQQQMQAEIQRINSLANQRRPAATGGLYEKKTTSKPATTKTTTTTKSSRTGTGGLY